MTSENKKIGKGVLFGIIIYVLFFPALLLFISGDWFWIQGWIFSIWFLALSYGAVFYMYRKDPDLLLERFRKPGTGGEKGWDKYFVYTIVILFLVWFIIMPLDAKRFMWTQNFLLWLESVGGITLIVSAYFMLHSYVDNTYLSPLVKIQKERDQKGIDRSLRIYKAPNVSWRHITLYRDTSAPWFSLWNFNRRFSVYFSLWKNIWRRKTVN